MNRAHHIELLTTDLTNPDVNRRAHAAEELGKLGQLPESTVVELATAAIDSDIGMRMRAGKTLAKLGKGAVPGVKVLTDAISSPDPGTRKHSAMAIGELGAAAKYALPHLMAVRSRVDDDVRSIVMTSLKRIAPHGVDVLAEWLKSGDQPRHLDAMQIIELAGRGVRKVTPLLIPLLADDQETVRAAAARALGRAGEGESSAVAALTAALDDPSSGVRVAALTALADAVDEPETAMTILLGKLEGEDRDVRDTAIRLLEPVLSKMTTRRLEIEKLKETLAHLRAVAENTDPATAQPILDLVARVSHLLGPGAASDGRMGVEVSYSEGPDDAFDLSLDADDYEDLSGDSMDPGVPDSPAEPPEESVGALDARVSTELEFYSVGARPDSEPSAGPSMVNFTVYSPTEASPDSWNDLLAYVHLPELASTVETDSHRQMEIGRPVRGKVRPSNSKISAGAAITVVPELPGCTFNPPAHQILWLEEWHRVRFRFRANATRDESVLDRATNGHVAFYGESILLGEVPLSVYFTRDLEHGVVTADCKPVVTKPYDAVFVSYSHDDSEVVNSISRAVQVLGIAFLRDQDVLRSGEQWNERILEMIPTADIFQLFWSSNARESKYVEQEWRQALSVDRKNFIRPLYWTKPMPKPPSELSRFHFAYYSFE